MCVLCCSGKISFYTHPPDPATNVHHVSAEIVSEWSAAFDLVSLTHSLTHTPSHTLTLTHSHSLTHWYCMSLGKRYALWCVCVYGSTCSHGGGHCIVFSSVEY